MECTGSESLGFIGCFSERHTAIADHDEFFRQRACSSGVDRRANAANPPACNGGSSASEHEQHSERHGAFEYEHRGKQCADENSPTVVHADRELPCELSSHDHNVGAATIANL